MARKRDPPRHTLAVRASLAAASRLNSPPLINSVSDTRRGHERGGVCLTRIAADDTLAKIRPRERGSSAYG